MTIADRGWRVVLETRDINGCPYHNIYRHVQGDTREEAIDYTLARYVGVSGGTPILMTGWHVARAWAVQESAVGEDIEIVPIDQPVFKRTNK